MGLFLYRKRVNEKLLEGDREPCLTVRIFFRLT